jgi:hypothetical protein
MTSGLVGGTCSTHWTVAAEGVEADKAREEEAEESAQSPLFVGPITIA